MKVIFCIALVFLFVGVHANVYKDCGSVLGTLENVKISECDEASSECILRKNTNVTISFDLISNSVITKVNTVVHGIMMGMPVPFPMPHPDACENTGLQCPLQINGKYSYSASLPVLKTYPKVKVDVKWELQDENKKDIACLLIPAKIQ